MRVLCGLALLLSGAVVQAHAHLQKAVPADGSVVGAPPSNIVLSFSEPARLTALWVHQDAGPKQKIGSLPGAPARQIIVSLPQLAPGRYMVSWRVVGADGHVVPGQIRFTISPADRSTRS